MPKLPILRFAGHAYLDLLVNAAGLARAAGLWVLAAWVLVVLGGPFAQVALLVGASAVAVAWHRRILAGDPLPRLLAPLDGRVARYLLYYVLLSLLIGLPLLLLATGAGFGAAPPGSGAGTSLLVLAGLSFACLYVAMRLHLVLPGSAVADPRTSLPASWAATAGHGWRLVLGFTLVSLPAALVGAILAILLGGAAAATESSFLLYLAPLAPIATAFIQSALLAAMMSYVYIFIVQPPPAAGGDVIEGRFQELERRDETPES